MRLEALRKSLSKFGDLSGIVFNRRSKTIVSGHQRSKVMPPNAVIKIDQKFASPTPAGTVAEGSITIEGERFKYREVDWDESVEIEGLLAANNHGGENDYNLIEAIKKDFPNLDFNLAGISIPTPVIDVPSPVIPPSAKEETDEQYVKNTPKTTEEIPVQKSPDQIKREEHIPDVAVKIFVKPGEVYTLGRHRLMCGDSTTKDLSKLLGKEKMDLVFTDPPYDQAKAGAGFRDTRPNWAEHDGDHLNGFDPTVLEEIFEKSGAKSGYFFCNKALLKPYIDWAERMHNWDLLVMGKKNPIPAKNKKFLPDIEYIVFVRKEGAHFDDQLEYDFYRKVRMVACQAREYGHPTEKQVGMCEPFLQISAPKHGKVLDCYGGSGTTLIACENTQRTCFMMEKEPKYVQIILERWKMFTGTDFVRQK